MTLKELINAGIVGGRYFKIVDAYLEVIVNVEDKSFWSLRSLEDDVLSRKVDTMFSYTEENGKIVTVVAVD